MNQSAGYPKTWTHTHDPFRVFYGDPIPQEETISGMADTPKTILIFAAHPDDCDVACGGSAAKWAAQGHRVILCVATNGEKGSEDPEMTPERLVQIREPEQRKAAEIMGIQEVIFLPNRDGTLEDTYEFRGQIVRLIRKYRPDRVLTHNPYRWQHRDHRMTGRVTLDAVYPYARDRLHYPELEREGIAPHKVAEVYLFGGLGDDGEADVEEDITEFAEAKLQARACHVSQFGPAEEVRQRWRARWEERSKNGDGRLTEHFKRVEFRV